MCLAMYGRLVYNREFFPFFHWSLYSAIPNTIDQPYIELLEINGEAVQVINLLSEERYLPGLTVDNYALLKRFKKCVFQKEKDEVLFKSLVDLIPNNYRVNIVVKYKDIKTSRIIDVLPLAEINNGDLILYDLNEK